jgi:5'-3' exonuclease
MREGQNFFNGMTEFKFLNIPALKGAVSKYLYNSTDVSYMYDYVFICFFLGNDFLPNVSCLKIKTGAIDVLVDIYRRIFESIQSHLILHSSDDFQINMEFLVAFLEKLAEKEDALMLESTKTFYESNVQTKTTITNKLEKFTYELDNYPSINKFPLVINPATDSTWKVSYYHHLFGNTNIRDYCQNYIEGLFWIVDYYFNRKTNMSWFYKYNYAPCLSDIFKHLMSMTNQKIELEDKDVINEDMQLLIVLPPSSKNLLNHKLLPIVEDIKLGCVHYYPVSFCLTSYLKSHLWECHPVIPVVDAKLIKAAYEKLTTK